jgi:hypothetical protein
MNFTKSKSIASGIVAALFVTVFAIGCDNGGSEKPAGTDSPKVDSPAVVAPKVDSPKVDSPAVAKTDSPKMDKANKMPVVKP